MYKGKHANSVIAGLVVLSLLLAVNVSYSSAHPIMVQNNAPVSQAAAGSHQAQSPAQSGIQPRYNNVQWSDAQDVSGGNSGFFPGLAMNGGEAQINFKCGSCSPPAEIYQTYSGDNGHTWAGPRYRGCDNGSAAGSTAPTIAEDSHLNVYMVWEDYCHDVRQLYFKKYDAVSNQ